MSPASRSDAAHRAACTSVSDMWRYWVQCFRPWNFSEYSRSIPSIQVSSSTAISCRLCFLSRSAFHASKSRWCGPFRPRMEGTILANLASTALILPKLASNVSTLETTSFNTSTSSTSLERDFKLHSTVSWSNCLVWFPTTAPEVRIQNSWANRRPAVKFEVLR